jgi:hypothetical protein
MRHDLSRSGEVSRSGGHLLVEFTVALSILSVGVLAFMSSYVTNYRAFNTVTELDEVHVAFEMVAETLVSETLQDVYNNFDGANIAVPNLDDPGGGAAQVEIDCFIDESNIPAEFGGVTDIYGNPGTPVAGPLSNLKILPVRLRVTYATYNGPQTRALYLVLGSG